MTDRVVDVVIVGGGLAGMTAALRAVDAGGRVVVLEKAQHLGGASYLTAGLVHMAEQDMKLAPDVLYERIMLETGGRARPELARALADNCGAVIDYLLGKRVHFEDLRHLLPMSRWTLAPVRPRLPGRTYEGKGGDVVLRQLRAQVESVGGQVLLETRGCELLRQADGRIEGIRIERHGVSSVIQARAIILAAGGFAVSPTLVRRYIGPHADQAMLRTLPQASGDDIRMGLEAGAKLINMEFVYGHLLARDALTNDELWPWPIVDGLVNAGILVNRRGERFVDEGLNGVVLTNMLARLQQPRGATAIFDQAIWDSPIANHYVYPGPISPNPHLIEQKATLHVANTFQELARQAGLDSSGLCQTIEQYNAAAAAGTLERLSVPRSGSPSALTTPPYYALPIIPGITLTLGGLLVNRHANVLNEQEEPIPGLYAAGASMGGLQGHPTKGGYLGGLAEAFVFGYLAGASAALLH